tara:strand:+ start:23900 stop:24451 length:552 start_codon:yes stop_codon:yes gene_type:complete
MEHVNRYNEYCILVSKVDSKASEYKRIASQKNKAKYELDSLKRELKAYRDISELNPENISAIKRFRMKHCLSENIKYETGGAMTGVPLDEFKTSIEYKKLSKEDKKLFKKAEDSISVSQYNLQNALIIGEQDDDNFDVYDSNIIEDYIDDALNNMADYDDVSAKEIGKLKQIMYKFVEQVSKT